jgi:outer membrane protein OmpA-like peptidoglycan-associated protein
MRNFVFLLFVVLCSNNVIAQETIKWASEVMHVTSETTALQYGANQTLHSPNVYPKGGESPNAWRPARSDDEQYIVVRFDIPIRAQQIAIAETENPGAITKVYAYDSLDNEYLLFDLNPRPIPLESRLLNLFFEKTPYRVSYLRVDLDGSKVPGFNSIDAIGLSSSNIPISVLIELAKNVNNEMSTEKLGENVNSQYLEQSPLLSPDGKTLYFSRRSHPDNIGGVDDFEDIWFSRLDEETQEWLPAENIGPPLNNVGNNFIASITQVGGETILLLGNRYEKKGRMAQGVSMTKLKSNGKWDKPINLDILNDYNYSEKTDYYMSQDTKTLLTSAERDDTFGDRDIYVSFVNELGEWTEPKNLGGVVNTADTESAPFLDADNKTLYFSSRGFRGYGEADIYVSKRLDDSWTNWSQPENMGRGVNGPEDDKYFSIPTTGSHAYFSRGNTDENTDVYRFRIDELFVDPTLEEPVFSFEKEDPIERVEKPVLTDLPVIEEGPVVVEPAPIVVVKPKEIFITVRGTVYDSKTNQPMETSILVERLPDGRKVGEMSTNDRGEFSFKLRPGAKYGLVARQEGYLALSENFNFNDVVESKDITRNLLLTPIEKGVALVLNNIFFEFDKASLTTSSYAELERILESLKDNSIGKIEISGHTDAIGDDNYNLSLSRRRARSVYSYFISNGVSEARLQSVGYGETSPVVPNDTADNRKMNRRVEFKIID